MKVTASLDAAVRRMVTSCCDMLECTLEELKAPKTRRLKKGHDSTIWLVRHQLTHGGVPLRQVNAALTPYVGSTKYLLLNPAGIRREAYVEASAKKGGLL